MKLTISFWFKINVRIQKGHSKMDSDNIRYTRRRQTKQKHNTICVGHHYAETDTNNVNVI